MEQFDIFNLVEWIKDKKCRLCPEKATWIDLSGGYCDRCFPNYLELGIDRKQFLRKKDKKRGINEN